MRELSRLLERMEKADPAAGPTSGNRQERRDDRRIRRFGLVAAGLFIAFAALAFGQWWMTLGLVALSLATAAWAVRA